MKMLIWVTQLGINVALPPVGFIYLAVKLQSKYGWGNWILCVGIILGLLCAIEGLRSSLKTMKLMTDRTSKEEHSVSFNDHD